MMWFRHYAGASFDPKFRTIARMSRQPIERCLFVWWAILEAVAEAPEGDEVAFSTDVTADHLGCNVTETGDILIALQTLGMIQIGDESGLVKVYAWDKRQFKSDSSSERVKRWREKKKQDATEGNADATLRNRHVTDQRQSQRQSQNKKESADADLSGCVEIWNSELGGSLGSVIKLTDARRTALRKRMADSFSGSLEGWTEYCRRIRGSPFLLGENDRGWRANFDWALKPSNAVKVQEGRFDPRRSPSNGAPARRDFASGMNDLMQAGADDQ